MNIFASLIQINSLPNNKVKYYSVVLDKQTHDESQSLFYDFLNRMEHENDHADDLDNLIIFLQTMATKYGARQNYFRNERYNSDLTALPPSNRNQHPQFIGAKLRLYTLRLNQEVVILFNGGIKTEKTAQECPNVKDHFKLANVLARNIDALIADGTIQWNEDCNDILYYNDLQIPLH